MSVTIRGLHRHFGVIPALAGVDLEVGDDELLVVLGPTGAGKTTLLRAIAGLETPDAGSIILHGRDAAGMAPADRDIALVFQNFSLYPEWTVRENISFPLRAPGRRLDEQEIATRVAWAAALLKLDVMLDRPAHRLSGGQMQRVAIGRAIVRRPKLFLMDEPLTNLDAKLREQLRVELAVLRRELKIPMIYVTHDQAEALSMGDRIAVLDAGRILQTGTPDEIYERPTSTTVAAQLGQPMINLLRGERNDGWWTTAAGLRLAPVSDQHPSGVADIGIRPEYLDLDGGEEEARVTMVEHFGPMRLVVIDWRGHHLHAVVEKSRTVARGDMVRPSIRSSAALLWPASDRLTAGR